jgi:hypothetical protein
LGRSLGREGRLQLFLQRIQRLLQIAFLSGRPLDADFHGLQIFLDARHSRISASVLHEEAPDVAEYGGVLGKAFQCLDGVVRFGDHRFELLLLLRNAAQLLAQLLQLFDLGLQIGLVHEAGSWAGFLEPRAGAQAAPKGSRHRRRTLKSMNMFESNANMGLTELLFQLELPEWPVAAFTKDNKDSRVIMNHIRFDEDHFPVRNIFTVLAGDEATKKFLALLEGMYNDITVLRHDENALSVLVEPAPDKMKFLKAPFTEALQALGDDRILRPIVIKDGWMTVGIITAAHIEIGDIIRTASDNFKKAGLSMKLVRWGEYRPEDHPIGDYEEKLTPKQSEIVKMGLALGFYDNPRRCNLEALAKVFGISKAAAHNRLKSAERKILTTYFS